MAHGHFAQFHAAGRVLLVKQINRFDRPPRGGMALPAGPQWLMIVAYFVLLIIAQGFLSRLLEPIGIAPPDLFLLTGAALAWRWRPVGALLGAFVERPALLHQLNEEAGQLPVANQDAVRLLQGLLDALSLLPEGVDPLELWTHGVEALRPA